MAQDYLTSLTQFPYPAVRVEAKNPAYARMMLGNIGDQSSEMSSFALYLYNQTITAAEPELTGAFRVVADVERKHLELLSAAAFQLGADPRLWAVTGNAAQPMRYWSPGLLSYTANPRAMLQNALALERATIAKYERQTQEIRDDGILLLLRRILLDESMHVEICRVLLADLDARAAAAAPPPAPQPALPAVAALPPAAAPSAAILSDQALPQQAQI
jgi:bacterioferritin